ncbi:MAG: hypothetical protein WHV44_14395 [Anaerolineales bacterium]
MQPDSKSLVMDHRGTPIPLDGLPDACFYSASGTLLARGYIRVVIGGRGAYLEFAPEHVEMSNLHISPRAAWRLESESAFYLEHRSNDDANVMVYEQRRTVDYADYRIGLFYIAPADVVFTRGETG